MLNKNLQINQCLSRSLASFLLSSQDTYLSLALIYLPCNLHLRSHTLKDTHLHTPKKRLMNLECRYLRKKTYKFIDYHYHERHLGA